MFPVHHVPPELSIYILSFLDVKDLIICSLVSKEWNILSNDDCLWMNFLEGCDFKPEAGFKSFLATHSVKSAHELVERIKVFVNSIEINQTGYFTCRFPGSLRPFASIKLSSITNGASLDPKKNLVMNLFLLQEYSLDFEDSTNVIDPSGNGMISFGRTTLTTEYSCKVILPTDKESEVYRTISKIEKMVRDAYITLDIKFLRDQHS